MAINAVSNVLKRRLSRDAFLCSSSVISYEDERMEEAVKAAIDGNDYLTCILE